MVFTTGLKQINDSEFTVKRHKDVELEKNLMVEIGRVIPSRKATKVNMYLYYNVPASEVKIGETVYTKDGDYYGYRRK